jgi:signal peptidase I
MAVERGSTIGSSGSLSPPGTATRRHPLRWAVEVVGTLALAIVIFWAIQTFVAQPYRVEQRSMSSTLDPDHYVLVDKLTPHFDTYSRGDIIVFNAVPRAGQCTEPQGAAAPGQTPLIKRVIGEPGDAVELVDGAVLINGVALDEPYVGGAPTDADAFSTRDAWVVQADRLFVMGDNRERSTDSRSDDVGEVCISDVLGRAWLRYWPPNTIGILPTPTYPNIPEPEGNAPSSSWPAPWLAEVPA